MPVIVAVDSDPGALADVERELRDRYARHYRIECLSSPGDALDLLGELAAAGGEVALVLAGCTLRGTTGSELLDRVRTLHPHAKRGLLIAWGQWGDRDTGEAIFTAIARGQVDHYMLRPMAAPDEAFHQAVTSSLLDWAEARRTSPYTIHIIGEAWSGRAYELRRTLGRCAIPHSFCLADSDEGRAHMAAVGDAVPLPVVVFPDGTVLTDPSDAEIALAAGSPVAPERLEFDLVIIGAGPAGLSAAVYGASEGFATLVVDEGGVGGQATSSSLIRNYLGFPRGISGRQLAQRAYNQAWIFGAKFAFMRRALGVARDGDDVVVSLSGEARVRSRAVLLATGATYHRLAVPELEALRGAGVFSGPPSSEAPAMTGRDVYVLGGGNSAGQAALYLAQYARTTTIVVRAASLGAGMSRYLTEEIAATPRLRVRTGTEITGGGGDARLERLVLRDRATGAEETVAADGLFVMIGARPHTAWLPDTIERDEQGFVHTGLDVRAWPAERAPLPLETSLPGIFAAGDVRRGSVKRVASAVGEGSAAIQLLHRFFAARTPTPA